MAEFDDLCFKHVRSGVMRRDWRRFIRHDWERFLKPGWETRMTPGSSVAANMYHQLKAEQRRQWPATYGQAARAEIAAEKAADEEYQAELAELRRMLADLKLHFLRRKFAQKALHPPGQDPGERSSHYQDQPRVPAGNPDGGQWTRVAAGDKPRLPVSVVLDAAMRLRRFARKMVHGIYLDITAAR
jgi:hypothetical protein